MSVKAIDTSSIHRICSGQVILDLTTAVKELVENSLDAQAKSIEIRFKEYGIQSVEVIDDGIGIHHNDYESLALKYHTSKLSCFEDLTEINSFGFRGEALSSLCALSKLVVSTCTQEETPTGTKLEYDSHGRLIKKSPIARERGTSVFLQGLFEPVPVRHREFKKNIKREFGKALVLLQAYGIICENVRISCTNQLNNNAKTRVLTTSGNNDLRDNIANIFGAKTLTQIIPLNIDMNVNRDMRLQKNEYDESEGYTAHIVGYISKPMKGYGRGSNDRQYYFINGRPCNLPKMAKAVNELYKSFNTHQYPFVVIDFRLAKSSYDVNVSPDKRTIFIHNEIKIVEIVREELNNVLEPFRSTFAYSNVGGVQLSIEENVLCHGNSKKEISSQNKNAQYRSGILLVQDRDDGIVRLNNIQSNESVKSEEYKFANCTTQSEGSEVHVMKKLKISAEKSEIVSSPKKNLSQLLSSNTLKKRNYIIKPIDTYLVNDRKDSFNVSASISCDDKHRGENVDKADIEEEEQMEMIVEDFVEVLEDDMNDSNKGVIIADDKNAFNKNLIISKEDNKILSFSSKTLDLETVMIESDYERQDIEIPFDIRRYKLIDTNKQDFCKYKYKNNDRDTHLNNSGIDTQDNEVAERELSRVILKRDFGLMEIIGQFNLGFIIVKLDNSNCNDLFIIDQHASDEKYNFENLQHHTKIQSQRLISPRKLDLTAAEELIAIENLKILQANGFELDVDYNASPTNKLKLLAQPMSKDIIFGVKDLEELIFLLSERPGEMVRCSHIRNMFASRACRKSIMIGDALSRQQMGKIVKHMGDIDQPWNCPHGRPTMRHLFDLSKARSSQPYTMRPKSNQSNLYKLFRNTCNS
ncbi:DNA mismatch repair protein MutL [Rhizophagus irregularis]|uniref:DNA mismatch repair protein PMS1 n=1 Tax=Rhizophagus irregularis TaxID=588596 RepID=A0A2N1MQ51_9GLOM|nr:DNA mismatch repair protein MutL [Rhizophagus irregularis]